MAPTRIISIILIILGALFVAMGLTGMFLNMVWYVISGLSIANLNIMNIIIGAVLIVLAIILLKKAHE